MTDIAVCIRSKSEIQVQRNPLMSHSNTPTISHHYTHRKELSQPHRRAYKCVGGYHGRGESSSPWCRTSSPPHARRHRIRPQPLHWSDPCLSCTHTDLWRHRGGGGGYGIISNGFITSYYIMSGEDWTSVCVGGRGGAGPTSCSEGGSDGLHIGAAQGHAGIQAE